MGALEVEIKLNVLPTVAGGPEAFLARLATVHKLGPFTLGPAVGHQVRDVYFDTADRHLGTARVALRLREQDGSRFVTLKAGRRHQGALAVRDESESPLTAASLAWEMAALVDKGLLSADEAAAVDADAFALGRASGPLQPLLAAATVRTERAVFRGPRQIGTMALDRVQYEEMQLPAFFDVEVEALEMGTEADLAQLQMLLTATAGGGLAPGTESKLARGLRLAAERRHTR